jgi:hypothetical protein
MGEGTKRGMSRHEGLRSERGQGAGPPDADRDLQTEIEDELRASGRTHVTPREGLIGAHERRREGLATNPDRGQEEPVGRGADVAPTRKAELREATRHDLEREVGHLTAGDAQGVQRQQHSRFATREALDGIAAEADQLLARRRLTAEGLPIPWSGRAATWLRQNRTAVAAGAGAAAAVLVIGGITLARRR